MKNLVRILMTLFLLVFTSGAVVHGGVMNGGLMNSGSQTAHDASAVMSDNSSASHHAVVQDTNRCDDCADTAGAIPACHFLCAIVVMPESAMTGDGALPTASLTVLPAIDRATGLSHAPDLSPPRYLS